MAFECDNEECKSYTYTFRGMCKKMVYSQWIKCPKKIIKNGNN